MVKFISLELILYKSEVNFDKMYIVSTRLITMKIIKIDIEIQKLLKETKFYTWKYPVNTKESYKGKQEQNRYETHRKYKKLKDR